MPLEVGERRPFSGNVTTLNVIIPGDERRIETMIGYSPGRLDSGYFILLLVEHIDESYFDFHGTTMRSGGRTGKPGQPDRERVQDVLVSDLAKARAGSGMTPADAQGAAEAAYEWMRQAMLGPHLTAGPKRIAKLLPQTRHDPDVPDSIQYPMGGGSLQWDIRREKPATFLVAAYVWNGVAHTASPHPDTRTIELHASDWQQRYDGRRRLRDYLESVR